MSAIAILRSNRHQPSQLAFPQFPSESEDSEEFDENQTATAADVEEVPAAADSSTVVATHIPRQVNSSSNRPRVRKPRPTPQSPTASAASDAAFDLLVSEFRSDSASSSAAMNSNENFQINKIPPPLLSSFCFKSASFDRFAEVRQRFGSSALRSETGSSTHNNNSTRGAASATRNFHRSKALKLVRPRFEDGDWPVVRGLSLVKMLELTSGSIAPELLPTASTRLFTFDGSSADYQRINEEYLRVLSHHDPAFIVEFTRSQPYFPPACLQLGEFYSLQQNSSAALACTERAIFFFQTAFHNAFHGRGEEINSLQTHRIDHRASPLNELFYRSVSLLAHQLVKQNSVRTAFSLVKFLISLSPLLDPSVLLPQLDYYAARACDYRALESIESDFDQSLYHSGNKYRPWEAEIQRDAKKSVRPPVAILPGIMFGLPLARILSQIDKDSDVEFSENELPPLFSGRLEFPRLPVAWPSDASLSASRAADLDSSHLMQRAILLFPESVEPLLKAAGHEKMLEKAEWRSLIDRLNNLFDLAIISSPIAQKLLLIFTERSGPLFRHDTILKWIQREAEQVIKRAADNPSEIASFVALRQRFLSPNFAVPASIASMQRTDYSDFVSQVPPEFLMANNERRLNPNIDFQFEDAAALAQRLAAQLAENNQQPLEVGGNENAFMLMLRSLLPWNTAVRNVNGANGADRIDANEFADYQFSSDEENDENQQQN